MAVKLMLNDHDLELLSKNTDADFSKVIVKVREKQGRVKAVKLASIDAICKALGCEPGDIFAFATIQMSRIH